MSLPQSSQSQHPLLVTGPTPQCYWFQWWAAWSSSSSSSALSSSAAGELQLFCLFCFLSLPLSSQIRDVLLSGRKSSCQETSLENTHTPTHRHTHARLAGQPLRLAHVGWVMTRHTGDVIDSSDSCRDSISDPSLPVPSIHLHSSHPSISPL